LSTEQAAGQGLALITDGHVRTCRDILTFERTPPPDPTSREELLWVDTPIWHQRLA